jgi:hypothetical protein
MIPIVLIPQIADLLGLRDSLSLKWSTKEMYEILNGDLEIRGHEPGGFIWGRYLVEKKGTWDDPVMIHREIIAEGFFLKAVYASHCVTLERGPQRPSSGYWDLSRDPHDREMVFKILH